MAYSADTFVADEQPTTAKWNKLWANDAAFNDGTGIANGAITANHISGFDYSLATTNSNPYKFSVGASATTAVSATTQKVALNSENFDTNNNFDSATNYRYTAPVNGFYWVFAQLWFGSFGTGTTEWAQANIYKNGSVIRGSERMNGSGDANRLIRPNVGSLLSLVATDYLELYLTCSAVVRDVGGGNTYTFMDGILQSRT